MSKISRMVIWSCISILFTHTATVYAEELEQSSSEFERKQYFDFHAGSLFPFQELDVRVMNSTATSLNGSSKMTADGGVFALGHGVYLTDRVHVETTIAYGQFSNLEMRMSSGFVGNPDLGTTVQGTGTIRSYSLSTSVYYDLDEVAEGVTPFVGLGATASLVTQSNVGRQGSNFLISDSDITTALCLIAGINMKLNEKTDLYARYVGIVNSRSEFSGQNSQGSFSTITPGGYRNAFSVGMKYYYK